LFSGTSHALWRGLVERAIAAGHLSSDVEPNAFAITLGHLFFACLLEWVYGQLSMEELEIRVEYGFALSLQRHGDGDGAHRYCASARSRTETAVAILDAEVRRSEHPCESTDDAATVSNGQSNGKKAAG
jgi:hypothetical protein